MTDEKVPYLQCLYHTGKKVYKCWLLALGLIAVIIAIGLIISKLWKQICDVSNYVGSCIGIIYDTISMVVSSIPWYWWIAIGVIVGPMVLVAIYCALKRYGVYICLFVIIVITIASILEIIITANHYINHNFNIFDDMFFGIFSTLWLLMMILAIINTTRDGDNQ